jgi:predicted O-methyltransferase YrrM
MLATDSTGAPIPWYTYPAIDFLEQRYFQTRNVLEFGGGQSTFWWSMRARSVLTIEQDSNWYAHLRTRIASNVNLHYVPVDHTTRSISPIRLILDNNPIRSFDIIIIDGHLREELTRIAFSYLAKDGALIFDNAEGYGFYDYIKNQDCRKIDFYGFAPGVSLRHCTSLVFLGDCFLLMPNVPIPDIETKET